MSKKGQLTIFFLEAGALLIVLGLVIFITTYAQEQAMRSTLQSQSDIGTDTNRVRMYMQDCLEKVSQEAVQLVSLQGGFIAPEGNDYYADNGTEDYNSTYVLYQENPIPVYIKGDNLTYPDRSAVEEKISRYVTVEFQKCLDMSVFEQAKIRIKEPSVDFISQGYHNSSIAWIETDIANASVFVDAIYPITIFSGNAETNIKEFRTVIRHRLGYMHSILTNNVTGVIHKLNKTWEVPSTYNLTNLTCDSYDMYNQTIIYKRDTDMGHSDVRILQVADHYGLNISNSISLFQIAVQHSPIMMEGDFCNATEVP